MFTVPETVVDGTGFPHPPKGHSWEKGEAEDICSGGGGLESWAAMACGKDNRL